MTLILGIYLFFVSVAIYFIKVEILRLDEGSEEKTSAAHHPEYLIREQWDKVDIPPLGFA